MAVEKGLGRPTKNSDSKAEKNAKIIQIESCKFGLGLLLTKRENTIRAFILLSVIIIKL